MPQGVAKWHTFILNVLLEIIRQLPFTHKDIGELKVFNLLCVLVKCIAHVTLKY